MMRVRYQFCSRLTLTGIATVALTAGAALAQGNGNGGGGGGGGGPNVSADIVCRIELAGPENLGGSGGELRGDGANPTNEYREGTDSVSCYVGRNRNIGLLTGKRSSRRLVLELGAELAALAGDNPAALPAAAFGPNIPDPSHGPDGTPGTADDGELSEVALRIGRRSNISNLGVAPAVDFTPDYCWPDNSQIPYEDVVANDPTTFRRMCSNLRVEFKVGAHHWRLYLGPPNRATPQFSHPTPYGAGPVIVERIFPNWNPNVDPEDPTVPWVVTVEPWQTTDLLDPRYGAVIGFLHYGGTKKNDPWRYVGAFDVPFASADPNDTPWLVYAL